MVDIPVVPFEDAWADVTSFQKVGGKYRVHIELQQKALQALQPVALNNQGLYLCWDKRYTPGNVELSSANLAQTIRNAYASAAANGGGEVIIPPGNWNMGHQECAFLTSHIRDNVRIRGSGMDCTRLNYDPGMAGTCFKFSGEASPGDFYTNGGISDLSINCLTYDEANTGTAIHIESTINFQVRNVTIRNFAGGTAFKARKVGIDGTNQYTQFWNLSCASNRISMDLQSLVNAQGVGVYLNSAGFREMLCEDVKASFYGGNTQTSAPIAIELVGEGLCRLSIYDFYYEGFCPVIFKLNSPSLSFNVVDIRGYHLGGNPSVFMDTDAFNNVTLENIYGSSNAATILKARNGPPVYMMNSGDPISLPGKFDLDSASAANLVCLGLGGVQYTGARMVAAKGFGLPSYALGAEPGSAVAGDVIRDTTHDRPSMKMASAWKRVAYSDDETDLSEMLRPYCSEIFDPRVKRCRSVISGGLDALIGLIAASSIPAPGAGQRPVWNASDDAFGGHPSFSCAFSGDHFLQGTLAVPVPAGVRPGLLLVFRANVAGTDANRRYIAAMESSSQNIGVVTGYSDLNNATTPYCYFTTAPAVGSLVLGAASSDVHGHVMFIAYDPVASMYFDTNAVATASDTNVTSHPLDRLTLGGAFDSSVFKGCDVTIAYAAVLKQQLLPDIRDRIVKNAMAKYGLR